MLSFFSTIFMGTFVCSNCFNCTVRWVMQTRCACHVCQYCSCKSHYARVAGHVGCEVNICCCSYACWTLNNREFCSMKPHSIWLVTAVFSLWRHIIKPYEFSNHNTLIVFHWWIILNIYLNINIYISVCLAIRICTWVCTTYKAIYFLYFYYSNYSYCMF